MARLRSRLYAVAIGASLMCLAGSVEAALRDHDSTLSIQLLGLPEIVMEAKPGMQLNVGAGKSVQIPASLFTFAGTLVPDFQKIPFTFAGKGTNLDTRLLRSVQVSLRNRSATLTQSGFIRNGLLKEWGGEMPMTGEFRMKFRPYVKKLGNDLITTTPHDLVIPAWAIGQTIGEQQGPGGATPVVLGGMRLWYLGENWRTGDATTFTGSATFSQLNQATPSGDPGAVYLSYINPSNPNPTHPHVRHNASGQKGMPFAWDAGDSNGYGSVTVVSPMAIHHQELRADVEKARLYTIRSYARLSIEIFPLEAALSFQPSLGTGVPTLAGAVGFLVFGVARRRR